MASQQRARQSCFASSRTSEHLERMPRFQSTDREDGEQPTLQHALPTVQQKLMSQEETIFAVLKPCD